MYPIKPIKPQPEQFNLTNELYFEIKQKSDNIIKKTEFLYNIPFIILFIASFIATLYIFVFPLFQEVDGVNGVINIFISIIICLYPSFVISVIMSVYLGGISEFIVKKITNSRLHKIKGYKDYCSYNSALESYNIAKKEYEEEQEIIRQEREHERFIKEKEKEREREKEKEIKRKEKEIKRKQHEYWMSINPYEFEKEIALLFKKEGYKAFVTKGSGDGGIDIKLEKDGKKGIVQCKRYKNKVGPGPIRDLYGTMIAGKFEYAFMVCPSGFSYKAYEFSKGKNIKLIGLEEIMKIVNA